MTTFIFSHVYGVRHNLIDRLHSVLIYLQYLYYNGRDLFLFRVNFNFLQFVFLFNLYIEFVFNMMRGAVRCIMRILSVYRLSL